MAHVLEISATVRNADGSEFYFEAHRWPGIDDQMLAWFDTELLEFMNKVKKEQGGKEDGENLSAVFSGSIDGVAMPDDVVSNMSYHGLVKMEHEWHKLGEKLLKIADGQLKDKAARKPKKP